MKRSALRTLLRQLALASLPLAGVGCGNGGNSDGAVSSRDGASIRDAAGSLDGASADGDMAVPLDDLAGGDMVDMCLGLPTVITQLALADGGADDCMAACEAVRPPNYAGAVMCSVVKTDGGQAIECDFPPCGFGRRPTGLRAAIPVGATSEVGDWLARAAHLEAASVVAFLRLAEELRALEAPPELVDGARRAAVEEGDHARIVAALARSHGATPAVVELISIGARSLEEFARENAVEGCVGETWGALLALRQAEAARGRSIRFAMRRIATDELRHAELAWEIADFVRPRLTVEARERVAVAQRLAAERLLEYLQMPSESACIELGLPGAEQARGMAREAARALWS